MKYSLLQLSLIPGDLQSNSDEIIKIVNEQGKKGSSFCITPNLALTGYALDDYLLYPAFVSLAEQRAREIAKKTANSGCALLLGGIGRNDKGEIQERVFFMERGEILKIFEKKQSACDKEKSIFYDAGQDWLTFRDKKYAVSLGDDYRLFFNPGGVSEFDVLINMSADVFISENNGKKKSELRQISSEADIEIIYVNAAGANDGNIFAGGSFWRNPLGSEILGALFAPEIIEAQIDEPIKTCSEKVKNDQELIFNALITGVRDYCVKIGISKIFIALSGGIDSALTAAIACKAIGPENVTGVLMPSPWSSEHSVTDANMLAKNLEMTTYAIPIVKTMTAYEHALAEIFKDTKTGVTEENLQARIRGDIVMALANKFGGIVLATSNKSEISVGYFTLYGDSCGALEVIGDLYKTEVYKLCRWINETYDNLIPENILLKAPSAELRPGQIDEDSLPPYEELDAILKGLLDERLDFQTLSLRGYSDEIIKKIAQLVAKAQFKRQQTAPVLKIHAPVCLDLPISGVMPFGG